MAKKAHAADAQLLLQLCELRREAERGGFREGGDDSRYSRKRLATADSKLLRNGGLVCAAGALSEELFPRPACSGEMFVMSGKVYPFLAELREKLGDPESFVDVEKVATRSKGGRERLKFMVKRPGGTAGENGEEGVKEEVTSGKITAKAPLLPGIRSRLKPRPTKPAGWRDGRSSRETR